MSKDITPKPNDYVCQSYDFSRMRHTLSMRYRKLLHVVMTHAQLDNEAVELTFRVSDLVKAFGKGDDSGKAYQKFRLDTFSTGLMQEIVTVPDASGGWTKMQWVSVCQYDKQADTLRVQLHDKLLPYVLDYRKRYTVVTLEQLNQFEGRHAWRYFEIFSTKKYLAGKNDNKHNQFFFDMTIEEIRETLAIAPTEYKLKADLRKFAVESPVAEINRLNCGLSIDIEPQRRGKFLTGFRFICTVYDSNTHRPVRATTDKEVSRDDHIEAHRERYDQLVAEERSQGLLIEYKNQFEREAAISDAAYKRLCEEIPLKRGRGRPKKT